MVVLQILYEAPGSMEELCKSKEVPSSNIRSKPKEARTVWMSRTNFVAVGKALIFYSFYRQVCRPQP